MFHCIPVSYTHLDVYKRQVYSYATGQHQFSQLTELNDFQPDLLSKKTNKSHITIAVEQIIERTECNETSHYLYYFTLVSEIT